MGLLLAVPAICVRAIVLYVKAAGRRESMPLATQVSGKRIGLLGMGNIGQAIARRARGFDMQVLYRP